MLSPHTSVLLDEVVSYFADLSGVIVDCTVGYGGHSEAILRSNPNVSIIGCDRDDEAVSFTQNRLKEFGDRAKIVKSNFSQILKNTNQDEICAVLADLGVSSLQLDKDSRGFSVNCGYLDMRMDTNLSLNAQDVVNGYDKNELCKILYEYGELKNSEQIAQKICQARQKQRLTSGAVLADVVGKHSYNGRKVSVATLVFQAIRIEVNAELNELKTLLDEIEHSKIKSALIAIISFHSLEDRIVKNRFQKWSKSCICPDEFMRCVCGKGHEIGKIVSKKAITPSKSELMRNSRSSCAKMRIFEISRGKNAR